MYAISDVKAILKRNVKCFLLWSESWQTLSCWNSEHLPLNDSDYWRVEVVVTNVQEMCEALTWC